MKSKNLKDEETGFAEKRLTVKSKLGLHARPAALFVQLANRFQSEIILKKGRQKANGKSIMDVLTLAVGPGAQVLVQIRGLDAKQAMAGIEELFQQNFGE